MSRIPDSFIDDLLHRIDIVEVVSQRVPLKRAGKEYSACCPFHDEKSPSFTVSSAKQFYHCFGCGAHGSAISFLMEYDGLGFLDAINDLARLAGMEVPREQGDNNQPSRQQTSPLYELLEQANNYYRQQLRQHSSAHVAVDYLKNRGVSGEIAGKFEIGFAPPGWDNLLNFLSKESSDELAQTKKIAQIVEAGLASENERKSQYDRLRDRITFPIRDQRGRVVGFGGRLLDGDGPKYLNSPETPIFHKGGELYGLYQLQQVQRQPSQIVVVEGYLDVIALAQFGATYAVAALGTALTADHIRKLYRVTQKLVLCFDGDKAGRRAAERSLENLAPQMQEGRQAEFLFLPDGDDPDTFIRREGLDGFESALKSAEPLSQFLFEHLESDCDMTTLDGKARLAELAKPWIGKLPEGFFKQLMGQELNQRTGIELPEEPPTPSTAINSRPFSEPPASASQSTPSSADNQTQPASARPVSSRLLRKAFVLLLNQPELAQQVSLEELTRLASHEAPGIGLLCMLIDHFNSSPSASIGLFLDQLHLTEEASTIARLIRQPVPPGDAASWGEEFKTLLSDITGAIHHQRGRLGDHNRRRLNELYAKFSASGLSDDEKIELRQLQQQYQGQSRREP